MKRQMQIVSLGLFISCLVGVAVAQIPSPLNCTIEREANVYAIGRQSDGRIIIGGTFNFVNGVRRNHIARLYPDGSLDMAWNPDADQAVYAVLVTSTNILIGGFFTNVSGAARSKIAKLDYYTGHALPGVWTQKVNAAVYALSLSGLDVYVGGAFTNIGSYARSRIARFSFDGNVFAAFTNGANGTVRALLYSGGSHYAAGDFSTFAGVARHYITEFHYFAGSVPGVWDPSANFPVYALTGDGSYVYAGGMFTSIGGRSRNGVAKIDKIGAGVVDAAWDPGFDTPTQVKALYNDLNNVYIGGSITKSGHSEYVYFAKVDKQYGAEDANWTNLPNDQVYALYGLTSETNIFVGGHFTYVGNDFAQGICKLQPTNGMKDFSFDVTASDPGIVMAIKAQPDGSLIVGGIFTALNGREAPMLVRLGLDGVVDTNWAPRPNGSIYDIQIYETNIYVAGTFKHIGGEDIQYIARLDMNQGHVVPGWTNRPNSIVEAITVDSTYLYAGGSFTQIGGAFRDSLAKLSLTGAGNAIAGWDANMWGGLKDIEVTSNYVYAAGSFIGADGRDIPRLARFSKVDGSIDATWAPEPDAEVYSVCVTNSRCWCGGYFQNVWNMSRVGYVEIVPFKVEQIGISNNAPRLTWRSGSNKTYSIAFAGAADGFYTTFTNGYSAASETNTFIDYGRSGYPRVFYRVREE